MQCVGVKGVQRLVAQANLVHTKFAHITGSLIPVHLFGNFDLARHITPVVPTAHLFFAECPSQHPRPDGPKWQVSQENIIHFGLAIDIPGNRLMSAEKAAHRLLRGCTVHLARNLEAAQTAFAAHH